MLPKQLLLLPFQTTDALTRRRDRLRLLFLLLRRYVGLHTTLLNPAHHGTQLSPNLLDSVVAVALIQSAEDRSSGSVLQNPLSCELPALNLLENLAHGSAHMVVNKARPARHISVLGCVGNGVAHSGDPGLIHEVYDELQLVQTLEVGDFRLIAGLHKRLKAGFHQGRGTSAQHRLLAKQIGFGLLFKGRLDNAGARSSDRFRIGQGDIFGVSGRVLVNSDKTWHPFALGKYAPNQMPRPLWCHHKHIYIGRRHDLPKVDVEPMPEGDGVAGLEMRLDCLLIEGRLILVVDQDHDDVGLFGGLGNGQHHVPVAFGGVPRLTWAQPHHHVYPRIAQVEGMRMPLTAIADHGHLFAAQRGEVSIFVVIDSCRHPKTFSPYTEICSLKTVSNTSKAVPSSLRVLFSSLLSF